MKQILTKLNVFKEYSGLPRSIYILFFAQVVNRMGHFVHVFLTLFLTQTMGLDESTTGVFVMVVGLSRMVGTLISGKLVDRLGRKRIMIVFQGLFALMLIPCGFLTKSMIIPWLLILVGFFYGADRPINNAMVTDLTTPEIRKRAFSLVYLGINIGVAVGPLIAGLLFQSHIEWIFWGDGLTSLVALVLILLFVPETMPGEQEIAARRADRKSKENAEEGWTVAVLLRRPYLLVFSIFIFFSTIVYRQHIFAIPIQLGNFFGDGGARRFGYIMSLNAVIVLALTTLLIRLTNKNEPAVNVAIANFLYAIGFGMLYFCHLVPLFFPLYLVSTLLWTLGEILHFVNYQVYVANHTPITHRGRFNALLYTITGSSAVLAPLLAGALIDRYGVTNLWPGVSALSLLVTVGLLVLKRSEAKSSLTV